jgi:hypothetical protein
LSYSLIIANPGGINADPGREGNDMAVRKKACAPDTDRVAEWAGLSAPEEESQLKKKAFGAIKKNVAREWAKGVLIPLAAIAGVSLMWPLSHAAGIWFWFGSAVFLVLLAIGFAYAAEFIKLLIAGDLLKQTVGVAKEAVMKEWMRVFLAFFAIGAGVGVILTVDKLDYYAPDWVFYGIGLTLIAGGITFFWTRSKFYRG